MTHYSARDFGVGLGLGGWFGFFAGFAGFWGGVGAFCADAL
ncbi:hypothetical protein ACN4EG_19845 [Alkalinema pantanalense CENA528]